MKENIEIRNKSLGINAILNAIKSVMAIIFPLITFPYVSRILQVDNLGKYNFANSFVSYFVLFASLGISTYAIREGSHLRENKDKISEFASEVFSINCISTLISYIIMIVCVIFSPKINEYKSLIGIFSVSIVFTTLGTEWIYSIFEEYTYITKRSILVQFISLVLLFVFVKDKDDYIIYACITVFASVGANIINFINAKKFCDIKFVINNNMTRHIKPIFILFASTLATTIYVNSDMLLLGFMTSDYNVGLYSAAEKIYRVVKTLLGAILVVSIPRLSNYLGKGKIDEFNNVFNKIFNILIIIAIPAVIGLFMLANDIIIIISDSTFMEASYTLRILCFALIFALFCWIFSSCLLIPYKDEKTVFKVTLISALVNVILNIILIPIMKEKGAAFTTLIAEMIAMFMYYKYSNKYIKINVSLKDLLSVFIASIGIIVVCVLAKLYLKNLFIRFSIAVIFSIIVYFTILLIFKNSFIYDAILLIQKKIKIKKI